MLTLAINPPSRHPCRLCLPGLPALQQHAERATFTATSRLELFAITPEYFRKRFDGGIAKAAARLQRVQGSAWCARFLHSCDALHLPIPHWLQLLAKHANLNVASGTCCS